MDLLFYINPKNDTVLLLCTIITHFWVPRIWSSIMFLYLNFQISFRGSVPKVNNQACTISWKVSKMWNIIEANVYTESRKPAYIDGTLKKSTVIGMRIIAAVFTFAYFLLSCKDTLKPASFYSIGWFFYEIKKWQR